MLMTRLAKIAMVASIAVFASLVVLGNITDYGTNFEFVRHVLAMDTIRPGSTIGSRAITSPALHHAAYAVIIAAEALTAALCWIGALRLLYSLRAGAPAFNRAKAWAVAGLRLAFFGWLSFLMSAGGGGACWGCLHWRGGCGAFPLRRGDRGGGDLCGDAGREMEGEQGPPSLRAKQSRLVTRDCFGALRAPRNDAAAHTSTFSAAMNASCGMSTLPNWRIFFLPFFCLSRSLRLRVTSPP